MMYNQPNYGPWNALADILGAYIQKRSIDGAMNEAKNFDEQAQQAQYAQNTNTAPTVQTPMGQKVREDAMERMRRSGVMPNTDFLGVNGPKKLNFGADAAFENNTGSFLGAAKQYSPLQMQQNYAAQNNPLASSPQKTAEQQAKYDAFAKTKAEHPEWFAGNTYIADKLTGDSAHDNEVKAQALAKEKEEAAFKASIPHDDPYKFENPLAKYGNTTGEQKPLSYDEYSQKLKQMRREAMAKMVRKYGIDAAGKAEKLIDEAVNDKLSSYGDRMLAGSMKQINSTLMGTTQDGRVVRADMSIPANKLRFLSAVQNHNIAAQRMGKPGYDMNIAKEIMSMDNVKTTAMDNGGNLIVYGTKASGGRFDDGSSLQKIAVIPKTLSPKDIQAAKDKAMDRRSRENIARANNSTKLQVANIGANSRLQAAQISAAARKNSGGSGSAHRQAKWADTLQYEQEAAIQSIRSGSTFEDPDDHAVESYRQNCIKALESGDLDDEDKAEVMKNMEAVMKMYADANS